MSVHDVLLVLHVHARMHRLRLRFQQLHTPPSPSVHGLVFCCRSVLFMISGRSFDRRVCIAVVVLFAGLPLAMLRKVSSLRFTGFMSVLFVGFFSVALLLRACQHSVASGDQGAKGLDTTFTNFFNGLCIIGFAMCNQTAVFPVRGFASVAQESQASRVSRVSQVSQRVPSVPANVAKSVATIVVSGVAVSVAVSVAVTACACHSQQVFTEMKQKTLPKFKEVSSITFCVAFCIYGLAGCVHWQLPGRHPGRYFTLQVSRCILTCCSTGCLATCCSAPRWTATCSTPSRIPATI